MTVRPEFRDSQSNREQEALQQHGQASSSGIQGRDAAALEPAGQKSRVDEPAKVMRIGSMARQLLEEVRSAPLDDPARSRLGQIYERSVLELQSGIDSELAEELTRISVSFPAGTTPSDAELRLAHAQLVGWLEGLFHGIQTTFALQEIAKRTLTLQQQLRPAESASGAQGEAGSDRVTAANTAAPRNGGAHRNGYL